MRRIGGFFELGATDLVGHLNCRHLTELDRVVTEGRLAKPKVWDPLLQILAMRGAIHEQNYVEHLRGSGLDVVRIDGPEVSEQTVAATLAAMRQGVPVIVQGALSSQGWVGRPDILCRLDMPLQFAFRKLTLAVCSRVRRDGIVEMEMGLGGLLHRPDGTRRSQERGADGGEVGAGAGGGTASVVAAFCRCWSCMGHRPLQLSNRRWGRGASRH